MNNWMNVLGEHDALRLTNVVQSLCAAQAAVRDAGAWLVWARRVPVTAAEMDVGLQHARDSAALESQLQSQYDALCDEFMAQYGFDARIIEWD